jgi:CHASE2 domain-containing sensor protein
MSTQAKMTPQEFNQALQLLDLTPTQFAKLVGSNDKNMRRAAEPDSEGPGPAASFALRLMLALRKIENAEDDHFKKNPNDFGRDGFIEVSSAMQGIAARALRGEFE